MKKTESTKTATTKKTTKTKAKTTKPEINFEVFIKPIGTNGATFGRMM